MEPLKTGFEGVTLDFFAPRRSNVAGVSDKYLLELFPYDTETPGVILPTGTGLQYTGVNNVGGLRIVLSGITYVGNGGGAVILSDKSEGHEESVRLVYVSVARVGESNYPSSFRREPKIAWENADVPRTRRMLYKEGGVMLQKPSGRRRVR